MRSSDYSRPAAPKSRSHPQGRPSSLQIQINVAARLSTTVIYHSELSFISSACCGEEPDAERAKKTEEEVVLSQRPQIDKDNALFSFRWMMI